jgi:hypothetical protein
MKEYILKPIMTPATLNRTATADKSVVARPVPAREPLPTATIDPTKPTIKLGLDVHLEFIMAVVQRGHGALQSPRKLTPSDALSRCETTGDRSEKTKTLRRVRCSDWLADMSESMRPLHHRNVPSSHEGE